MSSGNPSTSRSFPTRRRLRLVRLLVPTLLCATTITATAQSPVQRLGRVAGFGWGDGYHACQPSGFQPGSDLPPRLPQAAAAARRSPAHGQVVKHWGSTFYDRFDAAVGNQVHASRGAACQAPCDTCQSAGCDACSPCDAMPVAEMEPFSVTQRSAAPPPTRSAERPHNEMTLPQDPFTPRSVAVPTPTRPAAPEVERLDREAPAIMMVTPQPVPADSQSVAATSPTPNSIVPTHPQAEVSGPAMTAAATDPPFVFDGPSLSDARGAQAAQRAQAVTSPSPANQPPMNVTVPRPSYAQPPINEKLINEKLANERPVTEKAVPVKPRPIRPSNSEPVVPQRPMPIRPTMAEPKSVPAPTPAITAPAITAPVITAPTITAPAITAPTITAPAITAPTITAPTITAPAITVTAPAASSPLTISPPADSSLAVSAAVPPASPSYAEIAPKPRRLGDSGPLPQRIISTDSLATPSRLGSGGIRMNPLFQRPTVEIATEPSSSGPAISQPLRR